MQFDLDVLQSRHILYLHRAFSISAFNISSRVYKLQGGVDANSLKRAHDFFFFFLIFFQYIWNWLSFAHRWSLLLWCKLWDCNKAPVRFRAISGELFVCFDVTSYSSWKFRLCAPFSVLQLPRQTSGILPVPQHPAHPSRPVLIADFL